jgi:hypothetical protein
MEKENEGIEEVQDQAFDDAFKEAADKTVVPADKVEDPEEIKEEPAKAEESAKVDEPTAKIDEPAKIEKTAEELEAERELQRQRTLDGILKPHKEAWETEKAGLVSQIEELKKPKEEKKDSPSEEDALSPEDKEALAKYEDEFDVISKMEGKKREVELKKFEKRFQAFVLDTVKTVKEELTAQIAPAAELVKTSKVDKEKQAEQDHFDMIRNGYVLEDGTEVSGHPDYEKHVKDGSITKWIGTKPKYLQKGLLEICDHGTAEEVVELLSDFKKENNINPQDQPEKVVNIKREQKKQALRVVDTGKSAVQTKMHTADDFEGAFDEALHKGG